MMYAPRTMSKIARKENVFGWFMSAVLSVCVEGGWGCQEIHFVEIGAGAKYISAGGESALGVDDRWLAIESFGCKQLPSAALVQGDDDLGFAARGAPDIGGVGDVFHADGVGDVVVEAGFWLGKDALDAGGF